MGLFTFNEFAADQGYGIVVSYPFSTKGILRLCPTHTRMTLYLTDENALRDTLAAARLTIALRVPVAR